MIMCYLKTFFVRCKIFSFNNFNSLNILRLISLRVDLLKPEDEIKFSLEHFKAKQKQCGVFFNFLTNLNKLVQYETRDPFAAR